MTGVLLGCGLSRNEIGGNGGEISPDFPPKVDTRFIQDLKC